MNYSTQAPTLERHPRDTQQVICPKCRGEGSIITHAGNTFDFRLQQWYPLHEPEPCDACRAEGWVWA